MRCMLRQHVGQGDNDSIHPQSGEINYQVINNSLGHIQRQIRKAPNDLAKQIEYELKDHERVWKMTLPSLFSLLGMKEPKVRHHHYWKVAKDKENMVEKEKVIEMLGFIKQSYIEYPFMFDEQQFQPQVKKVRWKVPTQEEKTKKKRNFDTSMKSFIYYSHRFTHNISKTLDLFAPPALVRNESDRKIEELSDSEKEELANKIVVLRFESKYPIFSELIIEQVKKELPLTSSGFSDIKLQHIIGRKLEDTKSTLNYVVVKATQEVRFANETSILKLLSASKSIFVTRYFYSPLPSH